MLDASVQETIRTALAARGTGGGGHETVKPRGDVAVRVTVPLKFSLDVSVTFSTAFVWPMFRSRPRVDIEKSPTLTVNT